ncbi:hypothetical protein Sste5346_010075 [Sporothrix stenoceras]|uniref:EthD domain-containing protein n=1 Tax=Sporothrix stenoceras TaxID=5173 RepID=A0ABR3YH63_9PEZI
MAPCPYMLWVNSQPLTVDDDTWVKMYTTEHAMVSTKTADRTSFYRAIRSQRHVIGPPITDGKDLADHDLPSVGKYFLIHKFDSLQAVLGNDTSVQEAFGNSATQASLPDTCVSVFRIWELVKPIG